MRRYGALLFLIMLSSCGYHVDRGDTIAVSVPYVLGDREGELTNALISALSSTSAFRYTQGEGQWQIQAKIVRTDKERVGYSYNYQGMVSTNSLSAIENLGVVTVEISVVDQATGQSVLNKETFKTLGGYDYINPTRLSDVVFVASAIPGFPVSPVEYQYPEKMTKVDSLGKVEQKIITSTAWAKPVISFSLGQLDAISAAEQEALIPIFRSIAQKVIDALLLAGGKINDE